MSYQDFVWQFTGNEIHSRYISEFIFYGIWVFMRILQKIGDIWDKVFKNRPRKIF